MHRWSEVALHARNDARPSIAARRPPPVVLALFAAWLGLVASARADDPAAPGDEPAGAVVTAVRVAVRVAGDDPRARVRVEVRAVLDRDGRVAVPIGLDGLVLGRLVEGGGDLRAVATGQGRGWAAEVAGRGEHLVIAEATVPVRPVGAGRALTLAIPPAATTAVELEADFPLAAAAAGPDEPLDRVDAPGGARAAGHLAPRDRLDLSWQRAEAPGGAEAPALVARGELALTVEAGAIEARETWTVAAVCGTARAVVFRVEPAEEVAEVAVDGRPVAATRQPGAAPGDPSRLSVPLPAPLEAAASAATARAATITLATRRPRAAGRGRVAFHGHPIEGAWSQGGVIAVARPAGWQVAPGAGRGVRRVDPAVDLPAVFRGRPQDWLGFEFADQPFDLGLRVEPTRARFDAQARSTLVLRADRVEVTTTITGRVWQGQLFEARVLAPPGLAWQPVAPAPGTPSVRPAPDSGEGDDAGEGPSAAAGEPGRVLVATWPAPIGPGESFAVTLRGSFPSPGEGDRPVGLFRPLGAATATTEVALVSGRNWRFEPAGATAGRFDRVDPGATPADWPWPPGAGPGPGPAATWFRAEAAEATIPARVVARPRSVRHRAETTVACDRAGADVAIELAGDVVNGTTDAVEVALPPEVPDRWTAESGEGLDREDLGPDPASGWRRYRLKLPSAVDAFQVWIRYRQEFAARGAPRLRIQPIRLLDGSPVARSVRLASEGDVALAVAAAPGWTARPVASARPVDSARQVRLAFDCAEPPAPGPIDVAATLGRLADLPTLVASRLWIRTTQLPDGGTATTAQYRLEAHARSLTVRLPAGSRWVRAAAGPIPLGPAEVESLGPDRYRITLPASVGLGPVPLRIDSVVDAPPDDGTWPAPELVDGVVQQTAWELNLLGARVGVGVPEGWADENAWYRDGLLWKRHPRRDEADLGRWLADGGLPAVAPSGLPPAPAGAGAVAGDLGPVDDLGGRHSYLFSRPGPPGRPRFPTWSRSTLLLLCSGPILAVGLLILARRPSPRWVAAPALVLALGFAALVEPNTGLLIAESSSVGLVLTAIAAAIRRALDRRGRPPAADERTIALAVAGWDDPSRASVAPIDRTLSGFGPDCGPDDGTVVGDLDERDGGSTGEFPIAIGRESPGAGDSGAHPTVRWDRDATGDLP